MALPSVSYMDQNTRTEGEMKVAIEDQLKGIKQIPGAGIAEQALTLATDTITPAVGAGGVIVVDTEAAAGTDNLATIVQTNVPDGTLLLLGLANAAHVVTVKHLAGGTGQISLRSGVDLVMSLTTQWLMVKRTGTLWEEIWRSGAEVLVSPIITTGTVLADPVVDLGIASRQYVNQKNLLSVMENGRITVTMAANAVTIALKGNDGNDPSATNPVRVTFRSATATDGSFVTRTITAALSTVISSGSTGGTLNTIAARLYVGLLDNAGTVELYWWNPISVTSLYAPSEAELITTTAEGGAGAADSAQVLYSTTARSGKAHRVVAYFEATEATSGTWATAASKIQDLGPGVKRTGEVVQKLLTVSYTQSTGSTAIPNDNTRPLNAEGDVYLSQVIVPSAAVNRLYIRASISGSHSADAAWTATISQDSGDALAARKIVTNNTIMDQLHLFHEMLAGQTTSMTIKVKAGGASGATFTFNGQGGGTWYAGFVNSQLEVEEICT